MTQRREIPCPREPIGLSAEEAAAYLGVCRNTFDKGVEKGLMPQPHEFFGRLLWDAEEVRWAFRNLPRRGGSGNDAGDVDWGDVAA